MEIIIVVIAIVMFEVFLKLKSKRKWGENPSKITFLNQKKG